MLNIDPAQGVNEIKYLLFWSVDGVLMLGNNTVASG